MHDKKVISTGSSTSLMLDRTTTGSLRGFSFHGVNFRLYAILLFSVIFHGALIYLVNSVKIKPEENLLIEEIPERFARLIIEKPLPKKNQQIKKESNLQQNIQQTVSENGQTESAQSSPTIAQRKQAQKAVEARVASVEKKIRTVGVLGMLTGVGSTAKGPSVIDVLGAINDKKDNFEDLDKALEKMTGLKKSPDIDILDKKLVKSKDVSITHKEEIDNLIAGVGQASSINLSKKGDFIIQRPESIEGSASSSVKRDNEAINTVVSSHKSSIKMTYEKFLKRDPALSGKVTIRFTIAASGSVTMATIIENTTGNQEFEQEILRKIRMWRFDPIPEGDVTVSYPFVFTSSG